jgi:hypothetical protein
LKLKDSLPVADAVDPIPVPRVNPTMATNVAIRLFTDSSCC